MRTTHAGAIGILAVLLAAFLLAGCHGPNKPEKIGPTADFAGSPRTGPNPLNVQFTDLSNAGTSPITSWSWNFGDGSKSTEKDPNHTYTNTTTTMKSFSASLTVTTAVGGSTKGPLVGYINVNPSSAAIAVTSTPSGASITLDGTSTGQVTPHTFPVSPGNHTVAVALNCYTFGPAETVSVSVGNTTPVDFPGTANPGAIAVTSTPSGASITLDGTSTGQVTPHTFTVSAGIHTVAVVLNCYTFGPAQPVSVSACSTTPVDFRGTANPGQLTVDAHPTAYIRIDGISTGDLTPHTYTIGVGAHQVQVDAINPACQYSNNPRDVTVPPCGSASPVWSVPRS